MTVSETLLKLRKERELTQAEVAKACGMGLTVYTRYEHGDRAPTLDALTKLADFYGVSLDVLTGRVPDEPDDPALENMIATFDTLPENAQDIVLQIARFLADTAKDRYPTILLRLHLNRASAGAGYDLSDDDEWEEIAVVATSTAKRADFAVMVEGDSMEPDFSDGDIVLIKQTQELETGDVGLFIHEDMGYIKEYGEDALVSRNPKYPDIHGEAMTVGKVLGKARRI